MAQLELGLDTFGDITIADGGARSTPAQVIRDDVAEGSWRTPSAWISSALASIIDLISPCPRPT